MSYIFCHCDKAPWLKQLTEVSIYLGLEIQSVRVHGGRVEVTHSESSLWKLTCQTTKRGHKVHSQWCEWFETSVFSPIVILPSERPRHLILPRQPPTGTKYSNVQDLWETSHSNHHTFNKNVYIPNSSECREAIEEDFTVGGPDYLSESSRVTSAMSIGVIFASKQKSFPVLKTVKIRGNKRRKFWDRLTAKKDLA